MKQEELLNVLWKGVRQNIQQSVFLLPVAFLHSDAKGLQIIAASSNLLATDVGKAAFEKQMQDRVASDGVELVLLIAEAWAAEIEPVEADLIELGAAVRRAKDRPNRQEVVSVNAQTKDSICSGVRKITHDSDGKRDINVEPPELRPVSICAMRFFR